MNGALLDPVFEGDDACGDCLGWGCQVDNERSDNPTRGAQCRRCKGSGQEPQRVVYASKAVA